MSTPTTAARLPDPPRHPAPAPPPRRPGSVRRTATVVMSWPDGPAAGQLLDGRARDLLTPRSGEPAVLASGAIRVRLSPTRTIEHVETDPAHPGAAALAGVRAGGGLRAALAEAFRDQLQAGTPLYLLLDDIAGGSLVSGFALMRWGLSTSGRPAGTANGDAPVRRGPPEGICAGFRPGSAALVPYGDPRRPAHNIAVVPPLVDPSDPLGWHELPEQPPMAMRRARRIDVWPEGDGFGIDAMFRDSCWEPDGTEIAVHEYALRGEVSPDGTLVRLEADPRVLPFAECPAAAPNASWLVGTPAARLRTAVLERLRGPDCCTHLNDALRSLAEVPVLTAALPV